MDMGKAIGHDGSMEALIRRARVERDVALGDAIGEACALAWRAFTITGMRLRALVARRGHA
jgi:hypothetical protein